MVHVFVLISPQESGYDCKVCVCQILLYLFLGAAMPSKYLDNAFQVSARVRWQNISVCILVGITIIFNSQKDF